MVVSVMVTDYHIVGEVYLLHFSEPFHHARHYIGWTSHGNTEARLEQHLSGLGSPLVQAVHNRGIVVVVARVWSNRTRRYERRLHNRKNARRECPMCVGQSIVSQPALSIAGQAERKKNQP